MVITEHRGESHIINLLPRKFPKFQWNLVLIIYWFSLTAPRIKYFSAVNSLIIKKIKCKHNNTQNYYFYSFNLWYSVVFLLSLLCLCIFSQHCDPCRCLFFVWICLIVYLSLFSDKKSFFKCWSGVSRTNAAGVPFGST